MGVTGVSTDAPASMACCTVAATSATWMAAYRNPRVLLHPLPSASWGASAGWKILSIA